MGCPKCGQQNPAGAKFCGFCGQTLAPPPAPAPAAQPASGWTPTPPPQQPQAGTWQPAPPAQSTPSWSPNQSSAAVPDQGASALLILGLFLLAVFIPVLGAIVAALVGFSYMSSSASASKRQAGKILLGVGIVLGLLWLVALDEMLSSSAAFL